MTETLRRVGEQIRALRDSLGGMSQSGLAKKLNLRRATVAEWELGKRLPLADNFLGLAKLAPFPDCLFFFEQIGLKPDDISRLAGTLGQKRLDEQLAAPVWGEIVRIPRFRATDHGREEAGPLVPLPAEFIPNPLATLCLVNDDQSTGVIDAPKGLTILDTSIEGTEDLTKLWDRVVGLYFTPGHLGVDPEGIYVGRLILNGHEWPTRPETAVMRASLESLVQMGWALSDIGHYHEEHALRGLAPDDSLGRAQRWAEVRARAVLNFRFPKGIKIIGKVLGRLTGHLGNPKPEGAGGSAE